MTKPPRLFLIFDLEGRCATSDQFPKPDQQRSVFLGRRLPRFSRSLGLTTSCMSGSRLENQIRLFRESELGSIASALVGFLIGNIWEMRPCAKSIRGQRDRSRSDLGWESNERILSKKLLNMLSSSDEGQSAPSAERSGLPEMETIRTDPPGHATHPAFPCFQRDLLRAHNLP